MIRFQNTDRPLDEPEPSLDDMLRVAAAERVKHHRRAEMVAQSMAGLGPFWDQAHSEHAERIAQVTQRLMVLPGLTEAQRWQALTTAVRGLADEYATWRLEETE